MRASLRRAAILLGSLLALAALAPLGLKTYDPPLEPEPPGDEVTLFIPGIKGSFLVDEHGRRAWLDVTDAFSSGDRSLALPPGGDDRFGPLRPAGLLTRMRVVPFLYESDLYLDTIEWGQRDLPGFLTFPYEWRVDAALAVKALDARIEELAARRPGRLRVNLIGYSLGANIAVAYARYGGGDMAGPITWAGARRVKRLVLAGGTFGDGGGSFLKDFVLGDPVLRNRRLLAREAIATFASSYQILPNPGDRLFVDEAGAPLPLDLDDPATWERPWAAVEAAPGRPPVARKELLLLRRAFNAAMRDAPEAPTPPADLATLVVLGDGQPTIDRVRLVGRGADERPDFEGSPTTPGDTRVPARSAVPPRPLPYTVVKTQKPHIGLLREPAVRDAIRDFLRR